MELKLGFIGIGKIAGALVEGLCTSDMEPAEIVLSPRNSENAAYWAGKYPNVEKAANNHKVLDRSDIVFIALRQPLYRGYV
jgi:pyrroline-5-carboxylate reductase